METNGKERLPQKNSEGNNMAQKTKATTSVWRNFIHLIKTIKLPILLIAIAFILNLGRAAVQLLIPEKVAEVTAVDLAGGGGSA